MVERIILLKHLKILAKYWSENDVVATIKTMYRPLKLEC